MAKKRRIIGLVLFTAVAALVFLPGFSKYQEMKAKERQLDEKIRSLEAENQKLSEKVRKLEQDSRYIEKRAREKLGVVKKGEVLYRVVDEE